MILVPHAVIIHKRQMNPNHFVYCICIMRPTGETDTKTIAHFELDDYKAAWIYIQGCIHCGADTILHPRSLALYNEIEDHVKQRD